MQDLTTTGLIAQVRRRASMPTSQNLFTDNDILAVLNEELQNRIVPWLMAVREDYLYTYENIQADGVTTIYDLPERAVGLKIKGINIYDTSGNQLYELPRLDINSLYDSKLGYFITGSKINIYPNAINSNNIIRVHYYRRPNDLVKSTNAGLVTTTTPTTVVVASIPSSWTTSTELDFMASTPPFNVLLTETPSNIISTTITVDDTTGISNGDYVTASGESVYAQVPQEVIPLLCQGAALRILEYSGDPNGMQMALATYQQMERDNRTLLTPRSEGQPKKILNRNRIANWNWY